MQLLLLTLLLLGTPQTTPPRAAPARDAALEKKGNAVVKGHVKSADGRPLRRAQISVRGAALPNPRTASTGLEGEYEFRDLPAGRYTISATRGGFLPSQYGQRRAGDQGTPIELADEATIESIDFTLEPAGVISGRVTDETGEPVANASIYNLQSQFYRGRRQFVPVATVFPARATTDESGAYRLTSIAPGEYAILATLRETWVSDDKDKQTLGYAPSYFPGTANVADAQRIKVVAGQEAAAIDFSLVPGRTAAISGIVTGVDGAPLAGASVSLRQEIMGPMGGSVGFAGNARAEADGAFKLRNIAPGEYILEATGSAGDRGSESAAMPLVVVGPDIEGINLRGDAGGLVAGRVVTASGDALPPSAARVTTQSATFTRTTAGVVIEDGLVGADGRFIRRGPTGPSFVRISGLPAGWALQRVQVGDREVTDLPVDVRPGVTLQDVTVVVSNHLAGIGGSVSDAGGRPGDGPVVLFPAEAAKWHEASGSLRSARADQSGRYRFDAVRPGDYLIAATTQMEAWQANDPEFLAALRDRATKVTVGDATVTLDLRVTR